MIKTVKTALLVMLVASISSVKADEITSSYTTLDFEKHCKPVNEVAEEKEEAEQGGTYRCKGYRDYPIISKIGDLRESVQFGTLNQRFIDQAWENFGPWNSVNSTFEWRLRNGKPIAVIHRAFIDNINHDTGTADTRLRGQVLVISSIATPDSGGIGCVVGLVDARANKKAKPLLSRAITIKYDFRPAVTPAKSNGKAYGKIRKERTYAFRLLRSRQGKQPPDSPRQSSRPC